jgi:hypothetical protein
LVLKWRLKIVIKALSNFTASATELKKKNHGHVASGEGACVGILNRIAPVFYSVPAKKYYALIERLEQKALNALAGEREAGPCFKVELSGL